MPEQTISIKDLKTFFGYEKLADFSKDWKALTDLDKQQIKQGITDGTFNY